MKRRKFLGHCEKCKKSLCEEHAYSYVDGNNIAITNNSPYLCKNCYEEKYNETIKSDIECFKSRLVNDLLNIKIREHIETIKIDNLISYVENL